MSDRLTNPFGARATFDTGNGSAYLYRLDTLAEQGFPGIRQMPFSIKVLLEALLRECDGYLVTEDNVRTLAAYNPKAPAKEEIPFMPARVLLQDFTGVPAVVDLAAMRSAMARLGGDAAKINPRVPVHLVIDHSVMVDHFGTSDAAHLNSELEFDRNRERYEFLRWGQQAFDNFHVVPPASGICHQVNLEYIARTVWSRPEEDGQVIYPDSLVGTDSHTTMINGLGVLGWGVGGIEAEAVMLGQPIYMLMPEVVGVKLTGEMPEGATATDLVLRVTEMLRQYGVVGKFVEFYGAGLSRLSVPDRATIANMAPEYGATMGFFPVDEGTLAYMRRTGRDEALVQTVERYTKAQGLFRTDDTPDPEFLDTLHLDLSTIEPAMAGPKRPQDRVTLGNVQGLFQTSLTAPNGPKGFGLTDEAAQRASRVKTGQKSPTEATPEGDGATLKAEIRMAGEGGTSAEMDAGGTLTMHHGDVAIAAITSCTNTSNPSVMIGAGLVAKKAVARGLRPKPYVKTSLAPGSRVVTEYLERAGLTAPLDALGFNLVGYGCTTCIGNSGPLPEVVTNAIVSGKLVAAGVLSGNRNFEGRIHPNVQANFLASPPLVVAYALAGTVDIDLQNEPIGQDTDGNDVFLKDIWPTAAEIEAEIARTITPEIYRKEYDGIEHSNADWNAIQIPDGQIYAWPESSTYIQEPPYFLDLAAEPSPIQPIGNANVLLVVGDSTTTDHISPAGSIKFDSPAGKYLTENGVRPFDFNSYGSRRGSHDVMVRGTFANIRIKNLMMGGVEGGVTKYLPTDEGMPIYDASMRYQEAGTPLVVLGGKDYGMGSSRDWAAKGTALLGVKAVIVESFERIHRSNLIGMGVLPLTFQDGQSVQSLGLTGEETFSIPVADDVQPRQTIEVTATRPDGTTVTFPTTCRLDTPVEVAYYRNGGILHTVLRDFLGGKA
ncbi:MAG: aconitate hydratase AcnA [Rhodothermales bacterium]|nr:aconitate hydratase AcnA [Rhodothermales bacterium]